MVVFVNRVFGFNEFKFTDKGVCRIEFYTLVLRFLSYLITIVNCCYENKYRNGVLCTLDHSSLDLVRTDLVAVLTVVVVSSGWGLLGRCFCVAGRIW